MDDRERRDRRSLRWQEHDYAAGGTYFVTICTEGRVCLFGAIRDGKMYPNNFGLIVEQEWVRSGVIRPEVEIDIFAVMPNHLHGLLTIRPLEGRGPMRGIVVPSKAHSGVPLRRPRSLSSAVGQFKATSTRLINEMRGKPGKAVWQRGFHDRVVRDEDEFERIAWYIAANPERWESDEEFRP